MGTTESPFLKRMVPFSNKMLNLIYDALRRTVYCMIAFLAFLVLMPSLPPYINEFHGMKEPQMIPFVGDLAPNKKDRETERQRDRQTDRPTDRQTYRQADRQTTQKD